MNTNKENPKKGDAVPQPYEITSEGSLGILALGAEGIKAWRKKREEEKLKSNSKSKDE